ncbi:hypothetical protein QE152_g9371 [Popillia japonica]|uniref:Uncharacterized protein n=1 Tax=Popillia japonica TaxID=7064 RepID=A0AAW1LZD2_POPJA
MQPRGFQDRQPSTEDQVGEGVRGRSRANTGPASWVPRPPTKHRRPSRGRSKRPLQGKHGNGPHHHSSTNPDSHHPSSSRRPGGPRTNRQRRQPELGEARMDIRTHLQGRPDPIRHGHRSADLPNRPDGHAGSFRQRLPVQMSGSDRPPPASLTLDERPRMTRLTTFRPRTGSHLEDDCPRHRTWEADLQHPRPDPEPRGGTRNRPPQTPRCLPATTSLWDQATGRMTSAKATATGGHAAGQDGQRPTTSQRDHGGGKSNQDPPEDKPSLCYSILEDDELIAGLLNTFHQGVAPGAAKANTSSPGAKANTSSPGAKANTSSPGAKANTSSPGAKANTSSPGAKANTSSPRTKALTEEDTISRRRLNASTPATQRPSEDCTTKMSFFLETPTTSQRETITPPAKANTSSPGAKANTSSPGAKANTSSPGAKANTSSPGAKANTSSPGAKANTSSPRTKASTEEDTICRRRLNASTPAAQLPTEDCATEMPFFLKTSTTSQLETITPPAPQILELVARLVGIYDRGIAAGAAKANTSSPGCWASTTEESQLELPRPAPHLQMPRPTPHLQMPRPTPHLQMPRPTPHLQMPRPTPHLQVPGPTPHLQMPRPTPHLQVPGPTPHLQMPRPTPHLQMPRPTPHLQDQHRISTADRGPTSGGSPDADPGDATTTTRPTTSIWRHPQRGPACLPGPAGAEALRMLTQVTLPPRPDPPRPFGGTLSEDPLVYLARLEAHTKGRTMDLPRQPDPPNHLEPEGQPPRPSGQTIKRPDAHQNVGSAQDTISTEIVRSSLVGRSSRAHEPLAVGFAQATTWKTTAHTGRGNQTYNTPGRTQNRGKSPGTGLPKPRCLPATTSQATTWKTTAHTGRGNQTYNTPGRTQNRGKSPGTGLPKPRCLPATTSLWDQASTPAVLGGPSLPLDGEKATLAADGATCTTTGTDKAQDAQPRPNQAMEWITAVPAKRSANQLGTTTTR